MQFPENISKSNVTSDQFFRLAFYVYHISKVTSPFTLVKLLKKEDDKGKWKRGHEIFHRYLYFFIHLPRASVFPRSNTFHFLIQEERSHMIVDGQGIQRYS